MQAACYDALFGDATHPPEWFVTKLIIAKKICFRNTQISGGAVHFLKEQRVANQTGWDQAAPGFVDIEAAIPRIASDDVGLIGQEFIVAAS